jgi:predicted DNA-binding mobile mystery protein A
MNYWDKRTVRTQLDKKLVFLRDYYASGIPQSGWIKALREALGLSSLQLGKKAGLDQSRVSRLESAEKTGNLKIASLQKIAKGLGMQFVYGFVPEGSLEAMVNARAKEIALKRVKRLDDTMRLEKQGLSDEEQKKAFDDMVEKILVSQPKDFWDDNND